MGVTPSGSRRIRKEIDERIDISRSVERRHLSWLDIIHVGDRFNDLGAKRQTLSNTVLDRWIRHAGRRHAAYKGMLRVSTRRQGTCRDILSQKQYRQTRSRRHMALTERDVEAYECPVCGNLARHENVPCCDEPREPVDDVVLYDQPEIEAVIKTVFDLSSTDLAICRVLMTQNEATAKDLAAELSLDRTTINRRVNHLVELGVVEKHSRILEQGGHVNLYSNAPLDEVHQQFQLGLYRWLADAEQVLDELHQEKLKLMVQEADVEPTDDPDSPIYGDDRITGPSEATDIDTPDDSDSSGNGEKPNPSDEAVTEVPDARADGDGTDSQDAGTERTMSDDPESPADTDDNSSLFDRLLGRDRS